MSISSVSVLFVSAQLDWMCQEPEHRLLSSPHPHLPYHGYLWANSRDELLPAQAFPEHHTLSISVPFTHLSFFLISLAASQLGKWSTETRKRTAFGSLSEQGFAFSAVTALLSPTAPTALAVRHASKKTGGSSKNLGGKSRGKHYGIKKMEGHYVHAGNILGTQRQFRWHPGAHVGLGRNKCLYALEEGIVRYTKDVYVPNPKNTEAVDLVTSLPKGAVLYKTFVHVVPAKPEGTFKLVDML